MGDGVVHVDVHTLGNSIDRGLNRVPRDGPPTCDCEHPVRVHGVLRKYIPGSPPWWSRCCATGSWSAATGKGLAGSS